MRPGGLRDRGRRTPLEFLWQKERYRRLQCPDIPPLDEEEKLEADCSFNLESDIPFTSDFFKLKRRALILLETEGFCCEESKLTRAGS